MSESQNLPAIEMRDVMVGAMRDVTFTVIEEVNWSVMPGEFWVVAGQQQSGKSDLLMLAAGLMPPLTGVCKLFGNMPQPFGEVEPAEPLRAGLVFQGGQLFNQLTIVENIALPLQYHKNLAPGVVTQEVKSLLDIMELTPLADVTPANVAANWRQRVALARALVLKPELLLLDNPLAGLGTRHRQWWLRFLDQLWHGHEFCNREPATLVVTTDDLRPWENGQRKFSLLRDKKFIPLGSWNEVVSVNDIVVKELLAVPADALDAWKH